MAELPIMPVATDAILADTSHMSAEEFGAYCRLLFVMWRHGGQLPDVDQKLANIAGVQLKRWLAIKETVMGPMKAEAGQVTQKKLTDMWDKVQRVRLKRVGASNKRWSRSKYAANGIQMHNQEQSRSNAIPKPNITNYSSGTTSERAEPPEEDSRGEVATPPHQVGKAALEAIYAAKKPH